MIKRGMNRAIIEKAISISILWVFQFGGHLIRPQKENSTEKNRQTRPCNAEGSRNIESLFLFRDCSNSAAISSLNRNGTPWKAPEDPPLIPRDHRKNNFLLYSVAVPLRWASIKATERERHRKSPMVHPTLYQRIGENKMQCSLPGGSNSVVGSALCALLLLPLTTDD